MGKEKRGPSHSQLNGIIWITVVLIAILAIAFFSRRESVECTSDDSILTQKVAELMKKENSVYRSRYQRYPNRHQSSYSQRPTFHSNTISHPTSQPPTPTRQPLVVELNSADTTTLMLLHGIGHAFASRIVKYRNRLGGFTSTQQLLEVYGFTPELLDHIAPYLQLDNAHLRKININHAELKQLIKHPYMEYYFARDLVNLRAKGITFSSAEELRTIPSCTDSMLAKLLPYLEFEK